MSYNHTTTLLTFNNAIEASVVQDKLTVNGIPSFIEDENLLGLNPSAGTHLKVFTEDTIKAQQVLMEEQ